MYISDKTVKKLLLSILLCMPFLSYAVTQNEMEQARTIAAKAYLRYANDGSGYLDDLNPKTMEELEAALKPKEKENIKAFKAISIPSDYKDWDKEKLVEYWAVIAFQDKGLLEKGRGGRLRARSQINKMTITPPQPEKAAETPATSVQTQNAANPSESKNSSDTAVADNLIAGENVLGNIDQDLEEEVNVDKETNYTWVYIMVLAILVAIVIALVVYAANVMKKTGSKPTDYRNHDDSDNEALERYEGMIADKDVELAMVNKKLEAANRKNSELMAKVEALTSELAILKAAEKKAAPSMNTKNEATDTPRQAPKPALRSIYLGRANMRGIFVRADRTLNPGHSIYVLETSDGFSGSFRVADSEAAWSLALSNPKDYLETACTGHDLDDTLGVSRIITEASGTAVFEGGCWRVIRKAKIRYE